jgi:RNA polymerase sigma-70 factor, ECF subfamily
MIKPTLTTEVPQRRDDVDALAGAVVGGDGAAFSALADRYRRELQVHCQRMLGSVHDSEDAVQETFLRAWRWRTSFRGDSSVRAWLYRIATNTCFDVLRRRPQLSEGPELARMQLEGIPAPDAEPDEAVASKETIELAFAVAIRHLPPRQRAVLVLRGVLGLSAKDAASLLDASVVSVNSALQRARQTLKDRLPVQRLEWARRSDASEEERALLQRYVDAIESADADAFVEMLSDRAAFTLKPEREVEPQRCKKDEIWLEQATS